MHLVGVVGLFGPLFFGVPILQKTGTRVTGSEMIQCKLMQIAQIGSYNRGGGPVDRSKFVH